MAKKQRIEIRRDEDFSELDEEMDEALQKLEGTNGKIAHLLERYAEEGEAAIAQFLGEAESASGDGAAPSGGPDSREPEESNSEAGENETRPGEEAE